MLYACVDQTASSVANNLLHLWGIFGNIRQLTSDGASSFTSKLVADVCKLLRIKQFITSAHNPGSHGIVENRNREISKIARKVYLDIANASEKNWEVHLPLVQRILNAQNNISTGFSPYHLIFGTMVTQDLKALENPAFDIATIKDPHKFVRDLDNSLNIVFKSGLTSVEDQIIHNYLRQSESTVSFKVGDYVLLPNHRSRAQALGKFAPQLIGPMKVVKTFGNDFYELRDLVQDEPVFALLNTKITSEPNGLKVSFPVKCEGYDTDIQEFKDEAEDLYKWFKVAPKITGQSIEIVPESYFIKGDGWAVRKIDRHADYYAVAVMGQVAYPIERDNFNDEGIASAEARQVLNTNITIV